MTYRPPLATANSARADANRMRAAALLAVADETNPTTVNDIILRACTEAGKPLLRLTLKQLLLAQPGVGDDYVKRVITHITRVVAADPGARRITLSWLLDARASGRRFMAYCDAVADNTVQPWPGFPFAPQPPRRTNGSTPR